MRSSLGLITIENDWDFIKSAEPFSGPGANPSNLAALLYTSGSTGRSKGVMVTHANLWLGADSVAHYLSLASDDRVLALLPLSFDYGLNQMLSMFRAGGTVKIGRASCREGGCPYVSISVGAGYLTKKEKADR